MYLHIPAIIRISGASPRDPFNLARVTFLQETHDKRSQLFKLLVLEHLKLKNQIFDAEAESQKREEQHAAEVQRLQEDIDRRAKLQELLKNDFEGALLEKSKAEKLRDTAQTALKERAQNDQKLKTICDENDAKTKKAEYELAEFKSQSTGWLDKLTLLNHEMDRKSTRLFLMTEFHFSGCTLTMLASCRRIHTVSEGGL